MSVRRGLLFLCVANSARSQMAEGIARHIYGDRREIWSAGSEPSGLNPLATAVLAEIGIDIAGHRSKSVDTVPGARISTVVTLCAEEVCPTFPVAVERIHWPLPDPAGVEGSGDERLAAFRSARDEIQRRLTRLAKAELPGD